MTLIQCKNDAGRKRKGEYVYLQVIKYLTDNLAITRVCNRDASKVWARYTLTHLPSTLAVAHAKKQAPLLRLAKELAGINLDFRLRRQMDAQDRLFALQCLRDWQRREPLAEEI